MKKKRFTVKASSGSESYYVALDSAGRVASSGSTENPKSLSQLRSAGRKVKTFKSYEEYSKFLDQCYDSMKEQSSMSKKEVGASASAKRRFTVTASSKHRAVKAAKIEDWGDGPVKVFWKSGKWSIIMDGYGLGITDGWGVERPIIYTHKDPPTVAYDGTAVSVPPYVKRKFEELVQKGVLKNRSDLYESGEWDTYFNASTSSSKKAVKASAKSDTIVIFYDDNFVSSGGWDAVRGGIHDIVSRDDAALKACIDYCNSFGDPLIGEDFASPRDVADTMTEVIAAEYNESWDTGVFFILIPVKGTRGIEIFDKADMSVNAATDVKCSEEEEGFHLYGYDADGADVTTGYSDSEMGLEDEIGNLFADESVDTVDIYENGISGYGDYIGTVTRAEYDSDSTGRLLELLGTRDAAVESAKDVKCGYDLGADTADDTYTVDSFFGYNGDPFRGLADGITTDDWSEVESWSHEHLMKGENVKIDGPQGVLEITADEYNQAWEDGAADFDINEQIVDYKRRIVNSSTAIKCSDDVVDLDSIYDDVTNWQQSADELASWDQESMKQELMSIFNDDTVKTSDGSTISIDELAEMYTDAAHKIAEELKSDIESSDDIKCTYRDDTIDKEAVRELVLVITNDGDLYRQRTTPMIENLKKKVAKGVYDREKAVKLWQYLADEGVRRYDKDFGSGRGSVSMLNPATRRAIAEELRDYYEEQIMWDVEHANDGKDELTTL